jgi:hypothetical protein
VSFTIAAGPRQRILSSESRKTRDHILLSQIRDSHNLEGQVPFISLRNRVTQLYPQALGSLFVSILYNQSNQCFIKHHAMGDSWRSEQDEGEWSTSPHGRFTSGEIAPPPPG